MSTPAPESIKEPSRPKNAYWLFLEEQRPILTKAVPEGEKTLPWVAKAAGEKWKGLSADERRPFEEKAAVLKSEYEKQLEEFKANGGQKGSSKQSKRSSDKTTEGAPEGPKRPKNPYMVFLDEMRPILTKELPQGEKLTPWIAKTASEKWKALSEEARRPYAEQAAALRKDYEVKLEQFKASVGATKKPADDMSPKKKAKTDRAVATPEKKEPTKGTGVRRKTTTPSKADPVIDEAVLADARKKGWEGQLKNLAGRDDVIASGKSPQELFEALKASHGLVNPAKRALLGEQM